MATQRMVLLPRDALFFNDGRGWQGASAGRVRTLDWPFPPTVLGAIRGTVGRALEASEGRPLERSEWPRRTAEVRLGPSVALRRSLGAPWTAAARMWPVPADAFFAADGGEVLPLDPAPPHAPTLGRDDDPAREALWRARPPDARKPRRPPPWWTEAQFVRWLACRSAQHVEDDGLPCRRTDVHLALDPVTGTALEHMLYSVEVAETLVSRGREWGLGVEVETGPAALERPWVTFGGDGKLARAEEAGADLFAPPTELARAAAPAPLGLRLVAVTPACFAAGWLPDGFTAAGDRYAGRLPGVADELVLRAAFVPRPVDLSGWDMAAGRPKPTDRLVPAGAVYFFQKTSGAGFSASDVDALWLTALGGRTGEGLGRFVAGPWRPAQ
jgi:CRISPR-associated protein Cmr3